MSVGTSGSLAGCRPRTASPRPPQTLGRDGEAPGDGRRETARRAAHRIHPPRSSTKIRPPSQPTHLRARPEPSDPRAHQASPRASAPRTPRLPPRRPLGVPESGWSDTRHDALLRDRKILHNASSGLPRPERRGRTHDMWSRDDPTPAEPAQHRSPSRRREPADRAGPTPMPGPPTRPLRFGPGLPARV